MSEDTVQSLLEHCQAWGRDTSLGSLFQCSTTLWGKNLFLMSSLNFPWYNFMPACESLAPGPVCAVQFTQLTPTPLQNHRMLGIGRDLKRSSSPIPLPEQEHLGEVTQEGVQAGFECLQRRRLHNLPGQPVPVLCYPVLTYQRTCVHAV